MGSIFFGTTNLNNGIEPRPIYSLDYPTDDSLPRLKMDRHGSLEDFSTVTLRALKYFQEKILQRAKATWVPLLAGYPHQKIAQGSFIEHIKVLDDFYFLHPFAELVTYTVKYQGPCGLKQAFGTEKMRAPQYRETIPVHEKPGVFYEVIGRPMDNLIQFDCWASTGRRADALAVWFKDFMEVMKGSIMRQGFAKIEFWERGIDRDINMFRDDLAVRSLQFYVRTEEFYAIPTYLITEIDREFGIRYDPDDVINDYVRSILGSSASGVITPSSVPYIPDMHNLGVTSLIEKED
jgi:hypothetical protein